MLFLHVCTLALYHVDVLPMIEAWNCNVILTPVRRGVPLDVDHIIDFTSEIDLNLLIAR